MDKQLKQLRKWPSVQGSQQVYGRNANRYGESTNPENIHLKIETVHTDIQQSCVNKMNIILLRSENLDRTYDNGREDMENR